MFTVDSLGELFRYMEWADARMWGAALAHPAAREDEWLRTLLTHLHTVQRAFLLMWNGQSPESAFHDASRCSDLTQLRDWARTYYPEARQFVESRDAETLARGVVMPWVGQYEKQLGMTFAVPTVAETMFQVTSHTTHHRAQANARLRALGAEPPLVDYIGWVWFGKPAAEW